MSNSELTAYNYGRRLAQEAIQLAQEGQSDTYPQACILTAEETASLERLGKDRWWALVVRAGQEVLAEHDAVR